MARSPLFRLAASWAALLAAPTPRTMNNHAGQSPPARLARIAGPVCALLRGRLVALALAGLLCSCASTLSPEEISDLRRHVVSSDEEGSPIDPVSGEQLEDFRARVAEMLLEAAREASGHQTPDTNTNCRFAGHAHRGTQRQVRKLLIHVHGGLNSDDASRRNAVEKLESIDAEQGTDWSYPIFLTWPSGGLDSVWEHLSRLRFGMHLPRWLGYPALLAVLPFDLIQGLARSPQTILSMFATDLQVGTNVGFGWRMLPSWERAEEVYDIVAHRNGGPAAHQAESVQDFRVHLGGFSRAGWRHTYRFTRYVVLTPLKVVLTPLFIDGIGREAWRVMLHRASNTLRPTSEFENEVFDTTHRLDASSVLTAPATGAFACFFDQLEKFLAEQTQRDPDVCWEVTLIGHSMGAIIINDALQLSSKLPVRNVVLMAAACSVGEAEEALVPYLEKNGQTNLYILTLHPLAEAGEVVAADLPSRGSLLEWIDQWFESPDHPLDRRLGKWNNAINALHVFASVRKQVTLKGFGVSENSIPQKHGDFSDCPFWRSEFWDVHGPETY